MAYNQLTDAQAERLALLLEELGEAQQVIGKILRHGYDNFHPDDPATTNRMLLETELGHVRAAEALMVSEGDFSLGRLSDHQVAKVQSVRPWLRHQSDRDDLARHGIEYR